MRALDFDRDPRIEVGDQQYAGGAAADFCQSPDKPVTRDRRLAAGEATFSAGINHDGADVGAAGIGDDPGRHIRHGAIRHDLQQALQLTVFGSQFERDLLPLQQPRVVLLEPAVFLINSDEAAGPVERRFDCAERPRRDIEHRRGDIAQAGAEPLEHRLVGLADKDDPGG